jgi:hypothetical protein
MFKVIRKQTRPNTNVPFWQGQNDPAMSDDFRNYFYEKYVLTGKFISSTPEVGNNGLELTTTAIWNSEADCDESRNDPVCIAGLHDLWQAHGVATGVVTEVILRETF